MRDHTCLGEFVRANTCLEFMIRLVSNAVYRIRDPGCADFKAQRRQDRKALM
jgi:hypothetical protein